jgi:cytokinin dehydrogenase
MQFLSTQPACSYVEGFCSSCFLGLRQSPAGRQPLFRWLHAIQFSLELDADAEPQLESILGQLRCSEVVHREVDEHLPYLDRYQARFEGMRRTGAWEQTHPWFEGMLPADRAAPFIQELISTQPPIFGDGHRLFSVRGAGNPRFLQLPVDASDTSIAVALLPVGIPQSSLGIAVAFLERATALLHQHGGRRYLSGWLGARDDAFWRQHYGSSYADWNASKEALDPNHVLTSELLHPNVTSAS